MIIQDLREKSAPVRANSTDDSIEEIGRLEEYLYIKCQTRHEREENGVLTYTETKKAVKA